VEAALAGSGLQGGAVAAGASELLRLGRHLSLRELIKWGRRMEAIHAPLIQRSAAVITAADIARWPPTLREAAFTEAADIFASMLSTQAARNCALTALATIWAVPLTTVEHYSALAKPSLSVRSPGIC
jgi:hypothetical protein